MGLVLKPASIVMGLAWPGWIRLISHTSLRARQTASTWAQWRSELLVFRGGLSGMHASACRATSIAASSGSPPFSALLLLSFRALGRAVPPVLGASAIGWLEWLRALEEFAASVGDRLRPR